MTNILAIMYDGQEIESIPGLYGFITNNYDDYFYITDAITVRDPKNKAVIHYTDIRLRNIHVLVTNISDVSKVCDLQNKIIYYYTTKPKAANIGLDEYRDLTSKIDTILYSNAKDKQVIKHVLDFEREIIDVSKYDR